MHTDGLRERTLRNMQIGPVFEGLGGRIPCTSKIEHIHVDVTLVMYHNVVRECYATM